MRLALVINRSAGTFRNLPLESTVAAIGAALAEAGHQVHTEIVGRRELARTLSVIAESRDLDAVVVGGGDGTILTAIVAGLGRDLPLGILPLGTLNLFARDLGLPPDPVEAARVLAGATPRLIDLAEVNGLPFAIWASMGMHPWVVRRRDHMQRCDLAECLVEDSELDAPFGGVEICVCVEIWASRRTEEPLGNFRCFEDVLFVGNRTRQVRFPSDRFALFFQLFAGLFPYSAAKQVWA